MSNALTSITAITAANAISPYGAKSSSSWTSAPMNASESSLTSENTVYSRFVSLIAASAPTHPSVNINSMQTTLLNIEHA